MTVRSVRGVIQEKDMMRCDNAHVSGLQRIQRASRTITLGINKS